MKRSAGAMIALAMLGVTMVPLGESVEHAKDQPDPEPQPDDCPQCADPDGPRPPRRLSSDPNHPDYTPDCLRVGVMVNGKDGLPVIRYDMDTGHVRFTRASGIETIDAGARIQPYWRFSESRQQRRARQRWESKRTKQ